MEGRTAESADPALMFDPGSEQFQRDPYSYYRRLREQAPVYRAPQGAWLLTRYADCAVALADERLRNVADLRCYPDGTGPARAPGGPEREGFARTRGAVYRALAPSVIRGFRPRVQRIVDELLDGALEAGRVDLVETFSLPLASIVFCEIFGVPMADRETFRGWVDAVVQGVDNLVAVSAERAERRDRAMVEFSAYFRDLIARRRRHPTDDLLSELVAIADDGEAMTENELVSSCVILLITGHESTANFVANATLALLNHPVELRRLRDFPEIGPAAIEELMRYEAPAQLVVRAARTDLDLAGQAIAEGELVVPLLAAGNRDPDVFTDPDRLDLTRRPNPHLAFGHGTHFCLGSALARMEGLAALSTLVRRAPDLTLDGEPAYKPTMGLRGLATLPVSLC